MIKLNLGCCDLPLEGWINIDQSTSPHIKADIVADVTDLSSHFEQNTVDEIYAGHLLEHFTPDDAIKNTRYWVSLLKHGGKLAIVVPDFKEICKAYISGLITLDEMNNHYIYSYVQESLHRSMWDIESLFELFEMCGLKNIITIDKINDERLAFPNDLQFGVEGEKA